MLLEFVYPSQHLSRIQLRKTPEWQWECQAGHICPACYINIKLSHAYLSLLSMQTFSLSPQNCKNMQTGPGRQSGCIVTSGNRICKIGAQYLEAPASPRGSSKNSCASIYILSKSLYTNIHTGAGHFSCIAVVDGAHHNTCTWHSSPTADSRSNHQ